MASLGDIYKGTTFDVSGLREALQKTTGPAKGVGGAGSFLQNLFGNTLPADTTTQQGKTTIPPPPATTIPATAAVDRLSALAQSFLKPSAGEGAGSKIFRTLAAALVGQGTSGDTLGRGAEAGLSTLAGIQAQEKAQKEQDIERQKLGVSLLGATAKGETPTDLAEQARKEYVTQLDAVQLALSANPGLKKQIEKQGLTAASIATLRQQTKKPVPITRGKLFKSTLYI